MIRPIGKRVLIERSKPDEMKKGLLLMPGSEQPKNEGIILAVGAEINCVQKGEKIMFNQYGPIPIPGEEDLFFINESDILAVMDA